MTSPRLSKAQAATLAAHYGKAELLKARQRREMQDSLAAFAKEAWKIVEPHVPLKWSWHLEVICNALQDVTEGRCRRLLINIPPRHSKSVLVSIIWPAWQWLKHPGKRSIYASYDHKLMGKFAEKMQQIIYSSWYQDLIPALYGPNKNEKWKFNERRNALHDFANTETGEHFSTTVKGAVTGSGGDNIVVDDPLKASDVRHPGALELVIDWWDKTMSSRGNDKTKDAFVVIMQRLHEGDLAGHILAQDEAQKDNPEWLPYRKLIFPSEFDPEVKEKYDVYDDPRTQAGELLCPERFPQATLDAEKVKLGPYDYSAQHRQDPSPQGLGVFAMQKIIFWYPDDKPPPKPWKEQNATAPNQQIPLPLKGYVKHAQSWDLTFKETKDSDWVCGQYWVAHKDALLFLIDMVHDKADFAKTVEMILRFSRKHRYAVTKYIEDKANGPAVMSALKKKMMGLTPVNPEGGKEARANAASTFVASENIVLPHPALFPWVEVLLKEMRSFPKGKHDDCVDTMTQAINQMAGSNFDYFHALAYGASDPNRRRGPILPD